MKKVTQFLPALAILLGSGLAFATTKTTMAPQYYKSSTGEWRSLEGDGIVLGTGACQYSCIPSADYCTAEDFDHLGNPIGLMYGMLVKNP